ncbi:MAG: RNA polymerase sigma factor [Acidobacteriota bacterium]|nr:RNA polymerase sigma factor [Acidobacteriota bacterium]
MAGEKGHDEQFRAMYDRHWPRMVRFYRAYNLDDHDAKDLAQEAFKRVYERFEHYRGEAEWGFLQTIARNLLINWWRDRSAAKRSAKTVDIDSPAFSEEIEAPQEPDYAERQEEESRRARLYEEISKLPKAQQQVIRLQLRGLKYEEIATALRITLDAVKSRRRDALKQLKAALGENALPGGDE